VSTVVQESTTPTTAVAATTTAAGTTPTTTTPRSSSSSTVVQTSVISSNGVPITTIYTTTAIAAQSTTTTAAASSSHIGPIVAGVVGGIAAIGIIGLILFFFLKRRRDLDDFDGNFDPDRVVGHSTGGGTLPQIDLRDEVTPFEYGAPGVGEPGHMSQYGDNPYFVTGAGQVAPSARSMSPPSHYRNPSSEGTVFNQPAGTGSDTTGSNYGPSVYGGGGLPPGAGAGAMRVPSPPGSTSSMSQPRSAKEREALTQRFGLSGGGLGLATQHEENYDPAAGPVNAGGGHSRGPSDEVVVHSDGGRVNQEHEVGPTEIPPAYDSIPADDRSP